MKITKRQLRKIIKEERTKLLRESAQDNPRLMDLWNQMLIEFEAQFPGIDSSYYGDKIFAAMEEEYAAAAADSQGRQSDF